jgi:hypothetical protein
MKHFKASIMIAALAVFAFSCKLEVIQDYDVDGKAVNVQASRSDDTWGSVLSGTEVTLKDTSSGATYSSTVSSFGNFGFDGLPVGEYRMTASKSGWAFVPRVVEITGKEAQLPPLLGYKYTDNSIYIISEWKNESVDVDSYMVIDDEDNFGLGLADHATGNGHDLATVGITKSLSANNVTLTRDITPADIAAGKPAVETMTIASNPFSATNNVGWLKFYLDTSSSGAGQLTGNSTKATPIKDAQAIVHVMQGTTHFGSFPVATETEETTVMVVAINFNATTFNVSSAVNFGNGVFWNVK